MGEDRASEVEPNILEGVVLCDLFMVIAKERRTGNWRRRTVTGIPEVSPLSSPIRGMR